MVITNYSCVLCTYRFEFDDQLSIIGHANLVPRFSLLPGNEVVAMQ